MTLKKGEFHPRPYARLLTMLSDQLIKNNTIALTELAKNSYDADANWVQIRIGNMENFGKTKISDAQKPFVEIEDDGDGMSFDILRDSWMNPASPNKYLKRLKNEMKTEKGRIIQGEKGIGRYAVFQIGKKVETYTRERKHGKSKEIKLTTDLSYLKDELLIDSTKNKKDLKQLSDAVYLDELESSYTINDTPEIIKPSNIVYNGKKIRRKNHGTLIRITKLNYEWKLTDITKVRKILSRLQSPFRKQDFDVSIIFDGRVIQLLEKFTLDDVLEEAQIEMTGDINDDGVCTMTLKTGTKQEKLKIDLVDYLKQDNISENKRHFFDEKFNRIHSPTCGSFKVKFYVYDLAKISDKELSNYIKSHRIYIYRDDIRIYPYGDPDNDWIKLDVYRGLAKAGYYLSNDQVIGYVNITSQENPLLRDKTSREGLLEQGTAYDDLRLLTFSALNFLHVQYQRLKMMPKRKPKRRRERESKLYVQVNEVEKRIKKFERYLIEINDHKAIRKFKNLVNEYYKERKVYKTQIDIVEDLAGVGIAVDAAAHDLMIMLERGREMAQKVDQLMKHEKPDINAVKLEIKNLKDIINTVYSLFIGVQPLLRSSRRRNKDINIKNIIETVKHYYASPIKRHNIDMKVIEKGDPLIIKSNEGILLQLFINLMDNAIFWLKTYGSSDLKIRIIINNEHQLVIFADNGPGVNKKNIDYIFEPFFSTKGIHGRGLGLYIARQLTDKYEYDLYYIEKESDKLLPGANFCIDFSSNK